MANSRKTAAGKGGRPRKFDEPSKPVTVTLPLRVLEKLSRIDSDRARAIARAVDAAPGPVLPPSPAVCELSLAGDETLLAVADSPLLRTIDWLTLIEIAPNRHLLALRPGVPVEKFELTLGDLIDANPGAPRAERELLKLLLERLRTPRRNRAVRAESILVIRKTPARRTPPGA